LDPVIDRSESQSSHSTHPPIGLAAAKAIKLFKPLRHYAFRGGGGLAVLLLPFYCVHQHEIRIIGNQPLLYIYVMCDIMVHISVFYIKNRTGHTPGDRIV